ncbi:MAG: DUF169 domain-containing protein [Bacteroidales bacterium]|nr:DUF169 domain-containing protein [Bacteroidales bacterium]
MINELKNIFGPKCSAINVNGETNEFINVPTKQMKFCEAVNHSFNIPVRLVIGNLGCPGARRCIGFDNNERQLARTISEKNKIPVAYVINVLKTIPILKNIRHINLGMTKYMEKETRPDLYIIYVKPDRITSIIHTLAEHKITPSIPPFSLLSVCGNVFANCYINQTVSLSFGCPDSRKYGGIEENEVVLGLPYESAKRIIDL